MLSWIGFTLAGAGLLAAAQPHPTGPDSTAASQFRDLSTHSTTAPYSRKQARFRMIAKTGQFERRHKNTLPRDHCISQDNSEPPKSELLRDLGCDCRPLRLGNRRVEPFCDRVKSGRGTLPSQLIHVVE